MNLSRSSRQKLAQVGGLRSGLYGGQMEGEENFKLSLYGGGRVEKETCH